MEQTSKDNLETYSGQVFLHVHAFGTWHVQKL